MKNLVELAAEIYPLACAEAFPKEEIITFQNILLEQTIKHAYANSVFWNKRIPDDIGSDYRRALCRIPLLLRKDLYNGFPSTLTRHNYESAEIIHTTGTTGERKLSIYRCYDEILFLNQLYSNLSKKLISSINKLRPHWISTCDTLAHGRTIKLESFAFKQLFDNNDMNTESLANTIIAYISNPPYISGVENSVSVLSTTSFFISYMTYVARQKKSFYFPAPIKSIYHGSSYMLKNIRCKIEEFWGAEMHDVYSMTEMIGGGVRKSSSDYFKFQPAIIVEIVDTMTLCSISSGIGQLVLTCLFPFVQLHPRIRYLTTDLFEVDEGQYRYIGRLQNSAPIRSKEGYFQPRIRPVEFYECINEIPEIFRAIINEGSIIPDGDLGTPAVKIFTDVFDPQIIRIKAALILDKQNTDIQTKFVIDQIKKAVINSAIVNVGYEPINQDFISVEIITDNDRHDLIQLVPSKI